MKKIIWSVIGVGILVLFVGTAVFLYQKSQEVPVVYETTTPFVTDIVKKTIATGKILPRKEIEIKPQVSGVVDQLFVEAGDEVKKGDLIARIELIPDMEYLNRAESQLESAKISFENAKSEMERQKSLVEKGLVSEVEYQKFVLQYQLQKEAVRSAENNVALIKEGVSKQSGKVANMVKATVAGKVLDVPVETGSFVIETNTFNEGTTIANIANMSDMIFEGKLDEAEVGKVHEGMPLILNIGAIDGQRFDAKLEYISPKGIEEEGAVKFEIRAAIQLSEDTSLRAGYSANADIVIEQKNQVLALNEGNLIIEDGVTYVEVSKGNQQFERKEIKTGISDGINIEVMSGLGEKDEIKKLIN